MRMKRTRPQAKRLKFLESQTRWLLVLLLLALTMESCHLRQPKDEEAPMTG